jgi:hypothetical protein
MKALGEIINADLTLAKDFLAPLLAACKDKNEDRDVRRAAIGALVEVIKADTTRAPKCLDTLLDACKDKNEDRDVRMAAMGAMGEVIKAVPTLAPKCLDTLLDACKDENEHLRWDARKALEELSLEQLIECYWATKNKELIPIIAPRCYQTPLVVTDSNTPNYQKIVLYDTAGNPVSWNKPQKEVEELINLMKSLTGRDLFMI